MHDTENGTTVLYSCILFMAFEIFFYFDKYTIMIHSVYWGSLYGLYFYFYFLFLGREDQESLIHLMPEESLMNMVLRNGESILYAKLIFLKGLLLMRMDITIAVLPFHFLKTCN